MNSEFITAAADAQVVQLVPHRYDDPVGGRSDELTQQLGLSRFDSLGLLAIAVGLFRWGERPPFLGRGFATPSEARSGCRF
jgi:hypothetical protein